MDQARSGGTVASPVIPTVYCECRAGRWFFRFLLCALAIVFFGPTSCIVLRRVLPPAQAEVKTKGESPGASLARAITPVLVAGLQGTSSDEKPASRTERSAADTSPQGILRTARREVIIHSLALFRTYGALFSELNVQDSRTKLQALQKEASGQEQQTLDVVLQLLDSKYPGQEQVIQQAGELRSNYDAGKIYTEVPVIEIPEGDLIAPLSRYITMLAAGKALLTADEPGGMNQLVLKMRSSHTGQASVP